MERNFCNHRAGKSPLIVVLAVAGASLAGCSQSGLMKSVSNGFNIEAPATTGSIAPGKSGSRSELMKATTYWGQQYLKNPKDTQTALNYARNLRALGQKKRALTILERSRRFAPGDRALTAELGRLAVDTGHIKAAQKLLAEAGNGADWKTISAKGALEARQGNYKAAQALFNQALEISPGQTSILNNLAMAYALDHQADRAEKLLRQIVDSGKSNKKVRQNLALVLGLQGKFDQAREISARDLPVNLASANENYLRNMLNLSKNRTAGQTRTAGTGSRSMSRANSNNIAATQAGTWQTNINSRNSSAVRSAARADQPILLEPAQ